MAKNQYQTNEAGVIKADNPVKTKPSVTKIKGNDLRTGRGK